MRRVLRLTNLVVGYTCQDHLLLDLDDCDYWRAWKLGRMIQREYPNVGVCLIVHSSKWHYHQVYDWRMDWDEIVHIIQTLAALGIVQKEYATVRTFRRDLTLRVSGKNGVDRIRPPPQPVSIIGESRHGIPKYGIPRYLRLLNNFIDVSDFVGSHDWIKQSDTGSVGNRRLG